MKTINTLSTHTLDNVTGGAIRSSGSSALGYGGYGGFGGIGGLGSLGGGFPLHLFGKLNNTLANAQQSQQAQQNQTMTCLALACALKNR